MYGVFDEVWDLIKPQYQASPQSTEMGRLRLANKLLAAYRDGPRDAATLKATALARHALDAAVRQ